ncbi:MAG TPA: sulfite exporter TauE/SafE family protein [Gaiellales bacterium]|nr:sulfite exporter TauE/SafE family protein [Gaiellales bacterium]
MSAALLVVACGIAVAATLQSATGFGFALIAGPVVFAVVEPAAAVGLVLLLGQAVNLLVLFGERRRPRIDTSAVRPALLAALPGLPVGALLVRVLPGYSLRLAVGVVVCAAVAQRTLLRRRGTPFGADHPAAAVTAGFAVGVLTTSTTTNGPPLAIWLTARRLDPVMLRDTVTVLFLAVDTVGLGVLAVVLGPGTSFTHLSWLPPLLAVCVAGHTVGRRLFVRLARHRYDIAVLAVALAAAAASIVAGLR